MAFSLPPRSQVGTLAPEIAGEGDRVIFSDGESISWNPPAAKPCMPDWSEIKSIKRYFHRTGHQTWPAWLFHPTEEPRLVKNQDEANALGICYRQATSDEFSRYGQKEVWDWEEGCSWRPTPHPGTLKFDPKKPGQGKTYMAAAPDPVNAQNDLIRMVVPEVARVVIEAMRSQPVAAAPSGIDPARWAEFQKFEAWKKSEETVTAMVAEAAAAEDAEAELGNALASEADEEDERASWEAEAIRKGVKIDRRWSIQRLKSEVEKAA